MYNITEAAEELASYYASQDTPLPMYKEDYVKFIVHSIKKLYVDRNHPEEYNRSLFTTDEDENVCYDYDFDLVQEDYIFILAKLEYKRKIFADVSGDSAVSYTTDALSVTGAKEAYKSVQQEIDALERERLIVFHKMMVREEG